jgi:hypothetical protein
LYRRSSGRWRCYRKQLEPVRAYLAEFVSDDDGSS